MPKRAHWRVAESAAWHDSLGLGPPAAWRGCPPAPGFARARASSRDHLDAEPCATSAGCCERVYLRPEVESWPWTPSARTQASLETAEVQRSPPWDLDGQLLGLQRRQGIGRVTRRRPCVYLCVLDACRVARRRSGRMSPEAWRLRAKRPPPTTQVAGCAPAVTAAGGVIRALRRTCRDDRRRWRCRLELRSLAADNKALRATCPQDHSAPGATRCMSSTSGTLKST